MGFLPIAFTTPLLLGALVALPLIWWLLKITPPRPRHEVFPPLRILATVLKREETPSKSPWWLTLLRMAIATLVILALAGPVLNPREGGIAGGGPLVLVIDNSWASAPDWQRRVETASQLIDDAESADTPISLTFTADRTHDAVPATAATARERLNAATPLPLVPDRARAVQAIRVALDGQAPGTIAFITDGIASADNDAAVSDLAGLGPSELRRIEGDGAAAAAITNAVNGADSLNVTVSRLSGAAAASLRVDALDQQGRALASGEAVFAQGETSAAARVSVPFELRNDFARLSLAGLPTAGAVNLLDDGFRRRRVALLSGDVGDDFQPLLSPLFYIQRALQPYADLITPDLPDLAQTIPDVLRQNPSVIVLADIGRLPADVYEPLQRWISQGGTMIRFAGPRLAAAPAGDPLVPVTLRQGERALGGALSWSEPQPLADFPAIGPFAGMARPDDVRVRRQVLAEPTPDLAERTWASLADGTPLVTTRQSGQGRIVLFHVSAEATWSDLPISGNFVEMLRRLVQLSRAAGPANQSASQAASALPPFRLLTAQGSLTTERGNARPLDTGPARPPAATADNPPGLYGTEDGFVALNLFAPGAELRPLADASATGVTRAPLAGATAQPLKPWLLGTAFLLLMLDSLIMLILGGAFSRLPRRTGSGVAAGLAALLLVLAPVGGDARADDLRPGDDQILDRLDTTHLAYVVTGENEVDRISERGLEGLTQFLTYRTTLEPGDPVGVDISRDELSFYPIIFWPVSAAAPMPSQAAISRIDAYMRAGGTVLFDTRDQISSLGNDAGPSANSQRLQEILANIDIPPLEPVPADHVLTRSFYLLSNFPGRYTGSPLWVEARQEAQNSSSKLSSSGDGVTPLLITGNDLLGAWAMDENGAPLLPTVPADEMQREISFRAGVNIMMYMLTGNYKADQVHVPALLERLGQ